MAPLREKLMAAIDTFRTYDRDEPVVAQQGRYSLLWSFWEGSWQRDPRVWRLRTDYPELYESTRQLFRHASAVVNLYTQFVYPGDLSTDGQPLPDGTRGAIPLDPQTGSETTNTQLLRAVHEWWNAVRYKQHKSQRVKYAAILGDCLTELVDDVERGFVYPRLIWPGWVCDMQLNTAGDILAYILDYDVEIAGGERYGLTIEPQQYRYRKEVDRRGTWIYHDDVLVDEIENPYGFVAAIWDRHEIVWGVRGVGAFEKTLQAALEINSVLSHAMDYQARQFAAPIGVVGSTLGGQRERQIQLPRPRLRSDAEILADAEERLAEFMNLLPLDPTGKFVTVEFDVGRTGELLDSVRDTIAAENPESQYGQQILEMTQVTAPGVERALGPIIGLVKQARDNYDTQTIKEAQMAVAIVGDRLNADEYAPEIIAARSARYDAFAPFDLMSYGRGLLDCSIPDHAVIPDTPQERAEFAVTLETLTTEYGMRIAGWPEDEIAKVVAKRAADAAQLDAQLAGFAAGGDRQTTGPSGPTGDAQNRGATARGGAS